MKVSHPFIRSRVAILPILALVLLGHTAHAALLIPVTNTKDSGAGSLREAIATANSDSNAHIITFDLGSTCGPHVITLLSALPLLTGNMYINGYSQSGSSVNDLDTGFDAKLCVVLEGANAITYGLHVPAANTQNAETIRGLAFSGFRTAAIYLNGGSSHLIEGNRIGGPITGYALKPSNIGIFVGDGVAAANIGALDPSQRNVIVDAASDGIQVSVFNSSNPATLTEIANNYIGVDWNQSTSKFVARGNGVEGIEIMGDNSDVRENIIGGNAQDGALVWTGNGVYNGFVNNYIGTTPFADNMGNGGDGIRWFEGANGGDAYENTIANNRGSGIVTVGTHGLFLNANSIYSNGGLAYDADGNGVTANDTGAQNYPVLTGAIGGHTQGLVSGTLKSVPGTYKVEFFGSLGCDPSGYGEGQQFLGRQDVTIPAAPLVNGEGTASFTAPIKSNIVLYFPTTVITATALPDSFVGENSEYSACQAYTLDSIFDNGFEAPIIFI